MMAISAMPSLKSFRDLDVWQIAMNLALLCYRATSSFPQGERYTLTAQIRRAAASIPANVAEGDGRKSRKAYRNHVSIALGSHAELEPLLELATRLKHVTSSEAAALEVPIRRTGQTLHGLFRA